MVAKKKVAKKSEPAKIGRPLKEISADVFEGLCRLQCTLVEIAGTLGISEDTVERWCKRTYEKTFAEVFREKRAAGMVSLRRNQFKMAETIPTMAIWLGKQYLGQADKQEITGAGGEDFFRNITVVIKDGSNNRNK